MTFKIKIPGNPEELFDQIQDGIGRQGGSISGDINGGTIKINHSLAGLIVLSYKKSGDYYSITKVSGSIFASEDKIKQEIQKMLGA